MIRRPAVAGHFYPADPESLKKELLEATGGRTPPDRPGGIAIMVPHAGYIYSGRVAAETYTSVGLPDRVVTDEHPLPSLTLADAIRVSSNIALVKFAARWSPLLSLPRR